MRRFSFSLLLFAAMASLPIAASAQAAPRFHVTEAGGATLNNRGQFAGAALTGAVDAIGDPVQHAFLWDDVNTKRDLGTLPGGVRSAAAAVNNAGQVVGISETGRLITGSRNRTVHAFLWDAGRGMQDLGTLASNLNSSSYATAINDLGQVVGVSQNDQFRFHAFIWDRAHGMRDLGPEPGQDPTFYDSFAIGINNRGQVLLDAALWTEAGGMQSLASLTQRGAGVPGLLYVIGAGGPHSINDNGQFLLLGVVGFTMDEFPEPIYVPLRWDPGQGLVSLDLQGASPLTSVTGLNARGQVIGRSGDHLFGFFYDDAAGLSELQDLLALGSGWQGIFPDDINDSGQILNDGATSIAGGGVNNPILLTPDPMPAPVRALALHVPGRNGATAGAPSPAW